MTTDFSLRQRNCAWVLAAFAFLSRLVLGLRSEAQQASRLLLDDGYYMFSCARHLALGQGITADGVHLTNGIQPLLVFLEVPFFWIAGDDRWLGVRLSYILFAFLSAASVWLAARIMSRLRITPDEPRSPLTDPVIICAVIWAFTFPLFALMMNGLETGLYSMLLLVVINLYLSIERSQVRSLAQFAMMGVAMGLLILARIDALFFLLAIAVFELVRFRGTAILRIAILGTVALLVSSPWWIFNFTHFGSFMPISGQAESIGAVDVGTNVVVAFTRFANISTVLLALPLHNLPEVLQLIISVAVLTSAFVIVRRLKLLASICANYQLQSLQPFATASIGLAIIYVVHFHAPYFLDRYFQPIRILAFFIAAVAIANAFTKVDHPTFRWGFRAFLLVGLGYFVVAYSLNFASARPTDLYRAGLWAKSHAPVIVGMEQSGIAGFAADNVWNLDGKMNPDALRAMQTATLPKYIESQKFGYLADWDNVVGELLDSAKARNNYTLIDSIERVRIYRRIP